MLLRPHTPLSARMAAVLYETSGLRCVETAPVGLNSLSLKSGYLVILMVS